MPNNQYERDFNDLGALKRPGRLDFRILNNVDDAGDGHPGLQKAIRNYFHEGYLEKDINMNIHKIINLQTPSGNNDGARKIDVDTVQNDLDGFDDELKSLSSVEVQQLQNINLVTIDNTQWSYVASMQAVTTTSNVEFGQVTMGGNIVMGSNDITFIVGGLVDGVDVSTFKSNYDTHVGTVNAHIDNLTDIPTKNHDVLDNKDANSNFLHSTSAEQTNWNSAFTHITQDGSSHSFIDQAVTIAGTPTFGSLTITNNITVGGTVDGVNVSTHDHSGANQGGTVAHSSTGGRTANDHHNQSHVLSGSDHTASGLTIGHVIRATTATTFVWAQLGHGDLSGIGSNAHSVIDTHLGSTSNPHSVSLDQAFDGGRSIDGAVSDVTAVALGGSLKLLIWDDGTSVILRNSSVSNSIKLLTGENDVSPITIDTNALGTRSNQFYVRGGSLIGTTPLVKFVQCGINNNIGLQIQWEDTSTLGSGHKHISFCDSIGEVGSINSEVIYTEFTGAHNSQTESDDLKDWEEGMIVISTGEIIGTPTMGRALPKCDLSRKRKDKAVFGIYTGKEEEHNKKGFDMSKPSLPINALGEGLILVTDTNRNIEVGDYIQSSRIPGLGEKQDDDILHNYTVAKATQPVNWSRIKSKNGIKKKLIGCTYHCG